MAALDTIDGNNCWAWRNAWQCNDVGGEVKTKHLRKILAKERQLLLSQAVMRVCIGTQAHIGVKMAEEKAKVIDAQGNLSCGTKPYIYDIPHPEIHISAHVERKFDWIKATVFVALFGLAVALAYFLP